MKRETGEYVLIFKLRIGRKEKKMRCQNEKFVHKTKMHFISTFTEMVRFLKSICLFCQELCHKNEIKMKKETRNDDGLKHRSDMRFSYFYPPWCNISCIFCTWNDKVSGEIGRNKFKIENMQKRRNGESQCNGNGWDLSNL